MKNKYNSYSLDELFRIIRNGRADASNRACQEIARRLEAAQQNVQRTTDNDEPEFPIYYDSQGREHGEF